MKFPLLFTLSVVVATAAVTYGFKILDSYTTANLYDRNGDNILNTEEGWELIKICDFSDDNKIIKAELDLCVGQNTAEYFEILDMNQDGYISEDERPILLNFLDRNKDDLTSVSEIAYFLYRL